MAYSSLELPYPVFNKNTGTAPYHYKRTSETTYAPWATDAEACAGVPAALRSGTIVNVNGVLKSWRFDNVSDAGLVPLSQLIGVLPAGPGAGAAVYGFVQNVAPAGVDGSNNVAVLPFSASNTFAMPAGQEADNYKPNDNFYGAGFANNTVTIPFRNNTFGARAVYNTIGQAANSNRTGNDFSYNTLGPSCAGNVFGNRCFNNMLGNSSLYNVFGDNCQHVVLGAGVTYCKITASSYVSLGDNCTNVTVLNCNGTAGAPVLIPAGQNGTFWSNGVQVADPYGIASKLDKANNLNDLADKAAARANLGVTAGTAADTRAAFSAPGPFLTYAPSTGVFGTSYAPENPANKASSLNAPGPTTYPTTQATADGDAAALAAAKAYTDAVGVTGVNVAGPYAAGGNPGYPAAGTGPSGGVRRGDTYNVSAAGTVAGIAVEYGDVLQALVANPGQVAANWQILQANLFQATETVAGTAKVAAGPVVQDETTANDADYLTPKKGWQLLARLLAKANTWALAQTFTTAPVFSSAGAGQFLKTDAGKNVTGVTPTTADVAEPATGATNLYFTAARALAVPLAGYAAAATNRPVAATDTAGAAVGVLEKQIADLGALVGQLPAGTPAQLFQAILASGPGFSATNSGQVLVNRNGTLGYEGGTESGAGVPANTTAPAVSGNTAVGSVLSSTTGAWSNSPTGYAYQWRRNGAAISGATSSTYTTVSADGGTPVTCAVTAANAAGPATAAAASNAISVVGAPRTLATGNLIADTYIKEDYYGNAYTLSGTTATGYVAVTPGTHYTADVDIPHSAFYSGVGLDGNGNALLVSSYNAAGGTCPAGAAYARFSGVGLTATSITY